MKKNIIFFCFLILSKAILGHPHVFFENTFKLRQVGEDKVEVNINLTLDELNTALAQENEDNSHFFEDINHDLRFYYNGKKIENTILSKDITLEESNYVIDMTFDYNIPIKQGDKIIFTIYDDEYFYDYEYDESSLEAESENFVFNYTLKEDKKKPYYFNMVYPKNYEVSVDEK